jgi:hypothetical protein
MVRNLYGYLIPYKSEPRKVLRGDFGEAEAVM